MLLVKRELTGMAQTKGLVCDTGLPPFLATPWVVKQEFNTNEFCAYQLEDVLCLAPDTQKQVKENAGMLCSDGMLGYWSGFRSVIVRDAETGVWYKLKGVAPNLEKLERKGKYDILGTQKTIEAKLEWKMSERFNRVLEAEGIEPVMLVRGTWHYPGRIAGLRPAATIAEIKGDTRLEELLATLDVSAYLTKGVALMELPAFRELYSACGYAVGQLMRIMHRSHQVWGIHGDQTNAHPGNVVVYLDKNRLWVGLVDFDIAGDNHVYSKSALREQQKKETANVRTGLGYGWIRGMRPLAILQGNEQFVWVTAFFKAEERKVYPQRAALVEGFDKGYNHRTHRTSVDVGLLYDVVQCIEDARSKQMA